MGSNFFYCYSYDVYLSTQIVTNRTLVSILFLKIVNSNFLFL
jgi:hypothetical protein